MNTTVWIILAAFELTVIVFLLTCLLVAGGSKAELQQDHDRWKAMADRRGKELANERALRVGGDSVSVRELLRTDEA